MVTKKEAKTAIKLLCNGASVKYKRKRDDEYIFELRSDLGKAQIAVDRDTGAIFID